MVYVTSQPVHPMILDYYLQLLAGIPASHARVAADAAVRLRRVAAVADGEDPGAAAPHRAHPPGHPGPRARAYLTVFNSTPLERKLAVLLGIPLNGVDPKLDAPRHEVGQPQGVPRGRRRPAAGLRGPADRARGRERARSSCAREQPGPAPRRRQAERQLLGRGQRALPLSRERRRAGRRATRRCRSWSSRCRARRPTLYFDKFARMGGIVEEFIEAPREALAERAAAHRARAARSLLDLDARPDPRRPRPARSSWAARFPAHDDYRLRDPGGGHAHRPRAGQHGVVSRFGVDFLVYARRDRRAVEAARRSRSTCACAAPRTRSSRCSSSPAARLDPATRACSSRPAATPSTTGDRQPASPSLPRPAARGPDRHRHRTTSCTTATAPSRACCST